ncbi:MAG: O-antigen ligase family protein [Proteobacteria bacterium]|nr:O-antigen ligase family protein [Pseudomonadota bacterium]
MSDKIASWLYDDTPLKHKIVRLIFFLTSFSWTFNPRQDYTYSGGDTPIEKIITRMIPMLIVAVYAMTCKHHHELRRLFRPGLWPLLWYVLFAVLCGFSGIQPALCAWKGAEIIIAVMFFCVACRDADSTRKEFVAFVKLSEILIWITVFLAIIQPSLGLRHSPSVLPWLQGYLPIINPNALGFMSVLVLTRLLFLPARYKALRVIFTAGTLLCAQSRTSYAVMIVALGIYIIEGLRARQFGRVIISFGFAIIALIFAMGWHETILQIVMRGQSTEDMSSLSGRTDYWEYALEHVSWVGGGLATGSRSLIFEADTAFIKGTVNMHNSFIEALMGGGYIGAIPFIALIGINIFRQGLHIFTKPSVFEGMFLVCAISFAARGMTSVVLAIFSQDFNNMLLLWFWLYTRNIGEDKKSRPERPKPMPYEKTLAEQALEAPK